MEGILKYYESEIERKISESAETGGQSYLDTCNDLFGFNCSDIPLNKYERIFQKYQFEMGKSHNSIQGFNHWILNRLPNLIENQSIEDSERGVIVYFGNVRIYKPYDVAPSEGIVYEGLPDKVNIVPMYPKDAILRQKTYASEIKVDIYSKQKSGDNEFERKILRTDVTIGQIPIIKGSHYCWLNGMTDEEKVAVGECFNDPLGYFIIGGMEKVIIAKESVRAGQMVIADWSDPNLNRIYSGIRMYSLITSSSIAISLNVDHRNDNMIDVSFYNQTPVPVLLLSIILHIFNDINLIEQCLDYNSMMTTCKSILQNIIEPEILQFVKEGEIGRVKARLLSTIRKTISIIEKDIIQFIDENPRDKIEAEDLIETGEVILDPIAILSKSFEKSKKEKKFGQNYSTPLIETFRLNVFPIHDDDALVRNSDENDFERRRQMLSKMIATYVRYLEGFRPEDDRNSYLIKRIDTVGKEMDKHFIPIFKIIISDFKINSLTIDSELFTSKFETRIRRGIKINKKSEIISEDIERTTPAAIYSQQRRVTIQSGSNSRDESIRMIQPTQNGYICSGETPDGENCGILKNLTTLCWISIPRNINDIKEIIKNYIVELKDTPIHIPLLINGIIHGWCLPSNYIPLKEDIKTNVNLYDVSVSLNVIDNHIDIYTTGSLPTRPLFKINPETGLLKIDEISESQEMSMIDLIKNGIIEFNSPSELDSRWPEVIDSSNNPLWLDLNKGFRYFKIAEYVEDVNILVKNHSDGKHLDEQPFTHAEIIPHAQFGYASSCIPDANKNKGPRVTFQSSMFKQALSGYHSVHSERYDVGFKLHQFPSRTMFETSTQYPIGLNVMPTSATPIIAIYTRAMNNEDAIVAKREFFDNNLRFISYITYHIPLRDMENIDVHIEHEHDPKLHALYKHSDNVSPDLVGFPKLGSYVKKDDSILGVYERKLNTSTGETRYIQSRKTASSGKDGFIVGVRVIRGKQSSKIVKIKVAQFRRQVIGDKVASRYSQKGTFGQIVAEKDLPRIVGGPNDGVVPDLFFNPHSIPSRLTQGKILEILSTKAVLFTGERINASPFSNYLDDDYMKKYEQILIDNGMEESGLETLRHPDGTLLQVKIFTGACSYQVLKHHAADKIQVRDTGKVEPKTRQPVRGKVLGGGIRVGEMERDALISHGTSNVVLDRLMESSDLYRVVVCKKCGNIAISNFELRDTYCMYCDSSEFGVVNIPYVSHLIIRMLNAAGIHIHFKF